MPRTLSALIELSVGLACVAGAWIAWRVPGLRWFAVMAAVAGLAAVGHAAVWLVR